MTAVDNSNGARQWPLVAVYEFTGGATGEPGAVDTYEVINLPVGAIITGGSFYTPAGFTGNGTIAVQIGSVVLIAATDYDSGTNAVFDMTTDDATAAELTVADTVDIVVGGSPLTAGSGRLTVEYMVSGKANEVQPS